MSEMEIAPVSSDESEVRGPLAPEPEPLPEDKKVAPVVRLDKGAVIRLLGMPDLYEKCPFLFFMRELGLEAYRLFAEDPSTLKVTPNWLPDEPTTMAKVTGEKATGGCGACGGNKTSREATLVEGAVSQFATMIGRVRSVGVREMLYQLYEFVAQKTGRRPRRLLIDVRARNGKMFTIDLSPETPWEKSVHESFAEANAVSKPSAEKEANDAQLQPAGSEHRPEGGEDVQSDISTPPAGVAGSVYR